MALIVLLNFGAVSAQILSLVNPTDSGIGINFSSVPVPTPQNSGTVSIKNTDNITKTLSIQDINKQFGRTLFIVNCILIASSAIFGYILSGITLRPIQKSMKEQEEFAQDASHELRTPLTIISMEIESIKRTEKKITPVYTNAFNNINEEVQRMSTLVAGLLTLVHPDSQNEIKTRKPFDITASAKVAFLQLEKIAEEKNISYTFSSEYSGNINGVEEGIKQVIAILLENAIKYSRKEDSVELKVDEMDHWVLIKVSDSGPGIAKKDLPHIFERFYRAKNLEANRGAPGIGLGLPIAQKIVKGHQGKITIESHLGVGTTCSIFLPKQS
jgi:signal transduction histidine kinase